MTSDCFWQLFTETGEAMYYLLYREALEREAGAKSA